MVPEIKLDLPRPITSFHSLETESRCSLRCNYCVHKDLGRAKDSMSREVFERALVHVNYHVNVTLGQGELNLAGIGEPMMHPDLLLFVKRAREVVGGTTFLNFTTNGLHMTEESAKALAPYMSKHSGVQPGVFVSLHRPEKAKKTIDLCRKYGLLAGVSNDPAMASVDWAGQLEFEVTAPPNRPCPWIREGRAIVFSDGYVSTCCMDAAHDGVIGTVWDEPGTLKSKPYRLCASCDQQIGVAGYNQYAAGGGKKLPKALPKES